MNINDLKPASSHAQQLGCKVILFGSPGTSKTPCAAITSPNPVVLLAEPGALSLRGVDVPSFEAYTYAKVLDFFQWFFGSAESKKFDTLVVDSISQVAELCLAHHLSKTTGGGNKAHGLAAYGDMAKDTLELMSKLYFMPQKHIVLVAKRTVEEDMGAQMAKPYFPGKELNVKVPHMYDGIFQMGRFAATQNNLAIQCNGSFDAVARDRSGKLAMYEQPNIANIFAKMLS